MARIKILNENIVLEVPEGARLVDYASEKTNMPFGCKNGKCGSCLCTVMKGIENLAPPAHDEWTYLKLNGAYPNQRLACQIRVKKEGEIEIEY